MKNQLIDNIFENNQKWIQDKKEIDKNYFTKLGKGQTPEILYIGCSDSRVTAEEIMGAQPGEIFVHRNIANMVSNLDQSASTVINYAVNYLNVKHIVVCGHYECGGIKAAMAQKDFGILNPWLRNIRDVYRLHKDQLNYISNEKERYNRLVELNVLEQCVNITKIASVQKASAKTGLTVHGWVFDINNGKIIDLKIDFPKILLSIKEIYKLV